MKLLTPTVELLSLSVTLETDDRIVHETRKDKDGTQVYYALKKFLE